MAETVKILIFENEIEANLLDSLLNERGIPHMIRSFHDSALDGLFQVRSGWGILQAPEEFKDEILKLYSSMSADQGS
jgi:hypothetical protein